MRGRIGISAAAFFGVAVAVAQANQTVLAPAPSSCVPSRAPALPKVKGPLADVVRRQRLWLRSFPACSRATLAMAKTSLAKGTDGKVAIDKVVAVRGHLAVGDGEYNPVLHLDRDGQPSKCQAAGWRWDLVLCGGERIEIQLRGTTYPTNFQSSTCVKDILARHPSDAIVSGKLMKSGLFTPGFLRIEDAKICRP